MFELFWTSFEKTLQEEVELHSGCKPNHHSLLHELNEVTAQRRTTSGSTNTALFPGEELNTTSTTTAVPSVTAQQQNTASSANKLQPGIAGMFSGRVATSGPRVVRQIVPVFLYGPRGRLQTHALLDGGSNATLIEQDLARELGLSGPQSKLVLGGTLMDGVVDSFELKDLSISGIGRKRTKYIIPKVHTIP